MKKEIAELSKYHWMIYARSYLKLAGIGIEEFKNGNCIKKGLDEMFFYENRWLLIPIVWNLKHSIELIIKTLSVTIDEQYIKEHNLSTLKRDLIKLLNELNIEKPQKIDEIAIIIDKYYKCEFWDKRLLKEISIEDGANDLFRFPESKVTFELDLIESIENIPFSREAKYEKGTEELSEDIKKLGELFSGLDNQIEKSKFKKRSEAK